MRSAVRSVTLFRVAARLVQKRASVVAPVLILLADLVAKIPGPLIFSRLAHIHENWSIHGAVCAKGYQPAYPYELRVWKQLGSER